MSAILPFAAIGLQALTPVLGGISENSAARDEARQLEESGRIDESQGASDALAAYRASRMKIGEQMASMAGSGFAMGAGSARDLLAAALTEREMEAMNIRESARLQAEDKRNQAKARRKAGKGALIGGVLGGLAAAVGGASQMRSDARAANRASKTRAAQRAGYGIGG